MKAIKWSTVYGRREVEIFDTLDEAADDAYGAFNYGHESLWRIEHDGNLYDINWVIAREEEKREANPITPAPPVVAYVEVRSPDGKWATFEAARDMEDARRFADECMEVVGDDRVRITPAD